MLFRSDSSDASADCPPRNDWTGLNPSFLSLKATHQLETSESTVHCVPWVDSPIMDLLANPIMKGPESETATKLHLSNPVSVSFMNSVDQILIYSFKHSTQPTSRPPSVSSS